MVILGSLWGNFGWIECHFGVTFASFWHHLEVVLTHFETLLASFSGPFYGHLAIFFNDVLGG